MPNSASWSRPAGSVPGTMARARSLARAGIGIGHGLGQPLGRAYAELVHGGTHEALDPGLAEKVRDRPRGAGDGAAVTAERVGERRLVAEHGGVQHRLPLNGVFERRDAFGPLVLAVHQGCAFGVGKRGVANLRAPGHAGAAASLEAAHAGDRLDQAVIAGNIAAQIRQQANQRQGCFPFASPLKGKKSDDQRRIEVERHVVEELIWIEVGAQ